jgi:hypothetical protein
MTVLAGPGEKSLVSITTAGVSETEPVISVLAAAFMADPIVRWVYPDAHQYLVYFPEFVRAFGGKALEQGTAFCATQEGKDRGFTGAALWLAPDIHADEEALASVMERSIAPQDAEKVFALFGKMDDWHHGRLASSRASLVSASARGRPTPSAEWLWERASGTDASNL